MAEIFLIAGVIDGKTKTCNGIIRITETRVVSFLYEGV
jgi:hypothetical protein